MHPQSAARFRGQDGLIRGFGLSLLFLAACSPSGPRRMVLAISSGKPHSGTPAAGRLWAGSKPICGATLVGKQTALTSAHCLQEGEMSLHLDDGQSIAVTSSHPHPLYVKKAHGTSGMWDKQFNDIAVLLLEKAPSVKGLEIATVSPSRGMPVTLIGYGATSCTKVDGGKQCSGDGTKRLAQNTIEEVFQHEIGIAGEENACVGDSGSPVLGTIDEREMVFAITKGGDIPCTYTNATRMDVFFPWIDDVAKGDVNADRSPPKDAQAGELPKGMLDAGGFQDGRGPHGLQSHVLEGGCAVAADNDDGIDTGWHALLLLSLGLLSWIRRREP